MIFLFLFQLQGENKENTGDLTSILDIKSIEVCKKTETTGNIYEVNVDFVYTGKDSLIMKKCDLDLSLLYKDSSNNTQIIKLGKCLQDTITFPAPSYDWLYKMEEKLYQSQLEKAIQRKEIDTACRILTLISANSSQSSQISNPEEAYNAFNNEYTLTQKRVFRTLQDKNISQFKKALSDLFTYKSSSNKIFKIKLSHIDQVHQIQNHTLNELKSLFNSALIDNDNELASFYLAWIKYKIDKNNPQREGNTYLKLLTVNMQETGESNEDVTKKLAKLAYLIQISKCEKEIELEGSTVAGFKNSNGSYRGTQIFLTHRFSPSISINITQTEKK